MEKIYDCDYEVVQQRSVGYWIGYYLYLFFKNSLLGILFVFSFLLKWTVIPLIVWIFGIIGSWLKSLGNTIIGYVVRLAFLLALGALLFYLFSHIESIWLFFKKL